ncbi:hypothetical protein WJX84_007957 [Apatococcus fuscideae]|uniref:Cytochrome b561 domain-containing protein n=1 Tax=Apatococcus fuscideae TaxID=2026836 RepID=A0AAW1T911_9CHLO
MLLNNNSSPVKYLPAETLDSQKTLIMSFQGLISLGHSRSLQDDQSPEYYAQHAYLVRYHGWIMASAFGLLLPLSIVVARCFKERRGIWLHTHWILNVIAFLLVIAGVVLGHYLDVDTTLLQNHKRIGIAAVVIFGIQVVVAAGLRPKAFSHRRRYWNVAHWNLGRIVLVLGIVNLYIGMHAYGVSAGYYIALSVVLAFFLVVAVIKDSIDIISMPPVALVPEGDRERAIYSNQPLMTRGDRYHAQSNKNAGPGGHTLGKNGTVDNDIAAPGPAVNV